MENMKNVMSPKKKCNLIHPELNSTLYLTEEFARVKSQVARSLGMVVKVMLGSLVTAAQAASSVIFIDFLFFL